MASKFNLVRRFQERNRDLYNFVRQNIKRYAGITTNVVGTSKSHLVIIEGEIYGTGAMPVDTGRLIGSVEATEISSATLSFTIGSGLEYAYYVEHGTATQQAQQPFQKGIDKAFDEIINPEIESVVEGITDVLVEDITDEIEDIWADKKRRFPK